MLDPMTGLENRRAFDHWLASAPTQARPTALLLIDLDAFKGVNDRYGHAVGDDVLRGVAEVLAQHVRQGDKALRLGGDEFAVLLHGSPGADEAKLRRVAFARSRAIRAAVAHRDWDEITPGLSPTISIGVASGMLGPPRTETAEEIYRRADRDLYIAKSRRAVPDVP
jgi:diguanylate cyclase (GGDEF)-like protein